MMKWHMKHLWQLFMAPAILAIASPHASAVCKTVRVEHGRPIVIVSENQVLVLEFYKQPIGEALVAHDKPNVEHCREKYRYQVFTRATGVVTNGEGMVEEILETISRSPNGALVEDRGSKTQFQAGDVGFAWSKASPGSRSWLYYQPKSAVRFIQQPQNLTFDSFDPGTFERYVRSRNVAEFVGTGHTVHVIGPAVFAGELPTDIHTSARIYSARVHEDAFELKLSNLATNKHYVIDSSYEAKSGAWNAVHTFTAREPSYEWRDPLGKDVDVSFYRIREAAY